MAPFKLSTPLSSHPARSPASWNLEPRSSPAEAQPAGLIALGVCLGVALAIVLIWYTCCRAQTGPLKEIQMCKKGSRMRKEIRTIHPPPLSRSVSERHTDHSTSTASSSSGSSGSSDATSSSAGDTTEVYGTSDSYPSPIMVPPQAYGASSGHPNPIMVPPQAYGISHSYGDPAAPPQAYGVTDAYPSPVMAPPLATTGPEMTQPPKAYTHHAMSYLDPAIGGAAGLGLRKAGEPQMTPAHVQGGPERTEAPLGRRAVTSLPLPMFTRSLGVPVQSGPFESQSPRGGYDGPEYATARAPGVGNSNWWDAE